MKRKIQIAAYCAFAAVMLAAVSVLFSCKQKGPDQAIVTFVINDVKLARQGEPVRQVKHMDVLKKNDVITTGKDSFFAFQIGEESVIRMPAEATVKLTDLIDQNKNRMFVEKGSVYASVKKLGKGSTYELNTRTTVAAVRGTEFSVTYERGKAIIAVKEGSVKVQKVSEDQKVVEEKDIEGGTATEISKDASVVRPLEKGEQREFEKVEKVVIIINIQEKTESDLIKNEKEVLEGDKVEPINTEVKKDATVPAATVEIKQAGEATVPAKVEPKEESKGDGAVWTARRVYKSSDSIVVNYKNMPDSRYCWISVAKAGAKGGQFAAFDWTHSNKSGQMTFEGLGLEPGTYEARAHFNRSHNIDKRSFFKVE